MKYTEVLRMIKTAEYMVNMKPKNANGIPAMPNFAAMANKGMDFYRNTVQPALLAGSKAQQGYLRSAWNPFTRKYEYPTLPGMTPEQSLHSVGLEGMNSEIQWRNARKGKEAVRDWATGKPLSTDQRQFNAAINSIRTPPSLQ